jgi:DNA-binding NtrC family response regulator
MAAARLRAAVWQSIFTHDVQRYRRILFDRMGDIPTLIVGESGTGKELVARAIGLSRYVPFDSGARAFSEDYTRLFFPVNLAALSAGLIESELFGHRKGAFTGAGEDHAGWFETCPTLGSVFLDEVGELTPEIQVKLLRVLQSRRFQRVGEIAERSFEGKIIAATNRDLSEEMTDGSFRADFYYRLSGDVIRTPTLREQLDEYPNELRNLALILSRRLLGEREDAAEPEAGGPDAEDAPIGEADRLAEQVVAWASDELGPTYPWRGNVRELEQCVRNVMIRGEYRPAAFGPGASGNPGQVLAAELESAQLSADELLSHYCTVVYARVGSYEEAARRLGLDRRTVKAKIDSGLLERLRRPAGRSG